MEEKDFQRIEQMIGKAVRAEVGSAVKAEIQTFREELTAELGSFKDEIKADMGSFKDEIKADIGSFKDEIKNDVGIIKTDISTFKEEIKRDFRIQTGILSEDFQHKLQLVAEGNQMLSEKMDRIHGELNGSIQQLDKKVSVVAADVAAHRADTEGHKRGYMVKEP